MPHINRRTALASAATLAAAAIVPLASCRTDGASQTQDKIDNPDPNINLTGMPIVKDKITITMLTRRSPNTAEDWNTVASMKYMEELSNIHIDWGPVPTDAIEEKRNLALASGDYPEVLNRTFLKPADLARHGEDGTFIPLNQLIEEHMPNLSALLAANEDIRRGITFPEGNIYSLPTIYDPEFESLAMQQKLWVRQDWLDELGMSLPETLEEFTAYLTEVVKGDPSGSGSSEQVGFTDGSKGSLAYEMFWGTFGISNKGRTTTYLDTDESGAIRFFPVTEGYRDTVEYLHQLYDQGLIQPDIFTNDAQKFNSIGKSGVVGAAVAQAPIDQFGKEFGEAYVALPPLKRSSSDPVPSWNSVGSGLAASGQFVITDKAEHPVEAARWMDHFYGDEGARLFFMGIEGESYEQKEDGSYEFLPNITDHPDGPNAALRDYIVHLGGGYAGHVTEQYFKGTESSPQARRGTAAVAPHRIEETWPLFTYTSEEATELSTLSLDIDKLVGESRSKFITGELPISSWDTYVGQCEQLGLARYLEIQSAAYDRYRG